VAYAEFSRQVKFLQQQQKIAENIQLKPPEEKRRLIVVLTP